MAAPVALDASTAINLVRGRVLEIALRLDYAWVLGPLARRECRHDPTEAALTTAVETGLIGLMDETIIPASEFLTLKETYRLGDGETECIAYARLVPEGMICSDDLQARRCAVGEIGSSRVTGSLGLLRQAVMLGLLTKNKAVRAVRMMEDAGAFLPAVTDDFFESPASV